MGSVRLIGLIVSLAVPFPSLNTRSAVSL